MKWIANPLHYPIAVLVGGIMLALGVRVVGIPSYLMIPISGSSSMAVASLRKSQVPEELAIENPTLAKDLKEIHEAAKDIANKAEVLREETNNVLSDTDASVELDVLTQVKYACDRAQALPSQIETLSSKFQGSNSLLSVAELEQQLANIENKLANSRGASRQQLESLQESLKRNIQLAKQGEDARQAQVISLNTSIQNLAGVLQKLQNQLRTTNLTDSEEIKELQQLSEELDSLQENVDILTGK